LVRKRGESKWKEKKVRRELREEKEEGVDAALSSR